MMKPTYTQWLLFQYDSARKALIGALVKRDQMLYVEVPALRQEYMDSIGAIEEPVLRAELEANMLERKKELIQRAVNRAESVDIEAIDSQIEKEKNEMLSDMEKADRTLDELPNLSSEEIAEMNELYQEIVKNFHPQVNLNVDDIQKELYFKAVEAYKRQDIGEIRLLHGMLFDEYQLSEKARAEAEMYKAFIKAGLIEMADGRNQDGDQGTIEKIRKDLGYALSVDYTLAGRLYDAFEQDMSDLEIISFINSVKEEIDAIYNECAELQNQFPFIAKETLLSEEKLKKYKDDLDFRRVFAEKRKDELNREIEELLSGGSGGT